MPDKHAYQATAELADAIREVEEGTQRFHREVRGPWDEAHPTTPSLWVRGWLDRRCVGFSDTTDEVPSGTARRKGRAELVPVRGAAGDPWRAALKQLDGAPKLWDVFGRFGIDPVILRVDHSRAYYPRFLVTPAAVFVTWSVPLDPPSSYLTEIPLSVFYAAAEQAAVV